MVFLTFPSYQAMSEAAADIFAETLRKKPDAVLGLATGSTPIGLYEELARRYAAGALDFSAATSYNLDEYIGLAGDHPQSYRYFMNQQLFSRVNIDLARTFVPSGLSDDFATDGRAYDAAIAAAGGIDLQLLGIGNNGHIGFNEPDAVFSKETHPITLTESTIQANARFFDTIDEVPRQAITMGMGTIMAAKKVLLVANGAGKAEIVRQAVSGPVTPRLPASILQFHPDVTVLFAEQ